MINKLLSILWYIWYVGFMLLSSLVFPVLVVSKRLLSVNKYRKLVYYIALIWGRITVRSTGSRVKIEGLELIPSNTRLCFIGNHQSFFDIPAFMGYIGRPAGFIAKQELFKVPILSYWMRQVPCVFIDRDSARKAMISFQQSAELLKQNFPIVIFPEGGRSMNNTLGTFRRGSLKLPLMADATIIPFVIKDTWRIYEIDHNIHAVQAKIRILQPISPEDPIYHDKEHLLDHIYQQIETNLAEM